LPADLERFIVLREQAGSRNLYAETLEMMERYLITRVLRDTAGNQSKAAERLGITRGSLRNKIRTLGISIEHTVQSPQEHPAASSGSSA
jgi:two-component system nitrogen regulation response regulator GlnG